MSEKCHYYSHGRCGLLSKVLVINFGIPSDFCETRCKPNDPEKQKRMAMRYGGAYIKRVPPPERLDDYLERAKKDDGLLWVNPDANPDFIRRVQEQAEIENAAKELPSKFRLVKNLGRHALVIASHYKTTGRVNVSEDHQAARLDQCRKNDCGFHAIVKGSDRCKHKSCGCHLAGDLGKTRFEALPCPVGFHDEIDRGYLDHAKQ